jgi:hypothetical protein
MNFTDNNPLSMTGEDSFTGINEILARCVLIDTNQTILSSKIFEATTSTTFDGDVELNGTTDNTGVLNNTGTLIVGGTLNLNTDIVADKPSLNFTNTGSTLINPSNILALQIAGTDKFVTDMMNTTIYATSALNFSAGGSTKIQMTSANFANNFGTQQEYQVNNATKLLLANTATTLNNTTTNIQSGATNKITTNANTTTLNNETTNIQSTGGGNRITINPTTLGTNNDTTNIQSGSVTKIQTTGTTTTLTNDTIDLTGSTGLTISNTTGALRQWSPTMSFGYNPSFTTICDTMALWSLKDINASFNKNGLSNGEFRINENANTSLLIQSALMELSNPTIKMYDGTNERFSQNNGTTTITNTNIGTNGILTHTGNFTAKGTTITLQDATPTTKYLQNSTTTTMTNNYIVSNATIEQRIQVNGGDKFISIVGSTSIQDVIMGVTSTSGGLFLSSTSGKITMDTNNTSTDGILIQNKNTGAGGIRIESDGATGTLALDSAGTFNANTNAGKNSLSSTTGQIELKTGATTNTGINIENSSATSGGITLKTNGSTGDIVLTSGDNISITTGASSGVIEIEATGSNANVNLFANNSTGVINISSNEHNLTGTDFNNDVATLYRYGNLYPNLSIAGFQSQSATRLNVPYDITLNPVIGSILAVNDCQWISFPFDVKMCWASVSFTSNSFSNFTSRTFNLTWTNSSGTLLASANIGGMANAQRTGTADYAGEIIPANTDIIPEFVWTGTLGGGGLDIVAKRFCFTCHFQQA